MGKFEKKMIDTFSWGAKVSMIILLVSMIILLFLVMVDSCSDSITRVLNTTGCQCGCSCVTDTSSCKQCDEKIRTIVKEELDKQLLEVFD